MLLRVFFVCQSLIFQYLLSVRGGISADFFDFDIIEKFGHKIGMHAADIFETIEREVGLENDGASQIANSAEKRRFCYESDEQIFSVRKEMTFYIVFVAFAQNPIYFLQFGTDRQYVGIVK